MPRLIVHVYLLLLVFVRDTWISKVVALRVDDAYRTECENVMIRQLAGSHIREEECQRRVSEVYCSKLAAVELPVAFPTFCPLNSQLLSQPDYFEQGHYPMKDALAPEYREARHISVGFFILVSYMHLVQLVKRLVHDLWHETHIFLLHVDSKAPPALLSDLRGWTDNTPKLNNVHIFTQVDVKRSGASLLAAELSGLGRLLHLSQRWEYFLVLSDSDQSMRAPRFLQHFLNLHLGQSFINTEVLGGVPTSVAVECSSRVNSIKMGGHADGIPISPGLTFASGSQFVALHRDFAEFAALAAELLVDGIFDLKRALRNSSHGNTAQDVLREVLFFASPDETFFHTLAVNSHFCGTHVRHGLHFHDTQGNFLDESSRKYTDFATGSPPVLAEVQVPLLTQVRANNQIFFARKFDPTNSSSLAALAAISGVVERENQSRWMSIFHGFDWGRVLLRTIFDLQCMASVVLSGLEQQRAVGSAIDVVPSVYSLNMSFMGTTCLPKLRGFAGRGLTTTRGSLTLIEKYVVPGYGLDVVKEFEGQSSSLSPITWMRVGVGWNSDALQFSGTVSLIGAAAAINRGIYLVVHWRPAGRSRNCSVKWVSPEGQEFVRYESVMAWSMLSHSLKPEGKLPITSGWWHVEATAHEGIVVGSRRFYVFDERQTVPGEAVALLFQAKTTF